MKKVIVVVAIWAFLVGCSVLVLNHSHGNIVKDDTAPKVDTNAQIQALGKGNKMTEDNPPNVDSIIKK